MIQLISTRSKEVSVTGEHAWILREMIASIGHYDLIDAMVLDIGCNQVGLLHLL